MSNCINVIWFDKGETVLEERYTGEDFETATVVFTLKNSSGMIIGECAAIPVQSLFDITQLINISIKEKVLRIEQYIDSLKKLKKEHKHGTEKNQEK